MSERKSKFKVGQVVNLPVKILKIDRRYAQIQYRVQGALEGWVFDEPLVEKELRPLTKREIGK